MNLRDNNLAAIVIGFVYFVLYLIIKAVIEYHFYSPSKASTCRFRDHKHVRKFTGQPLPNGTSLHQVGLYGALSTRYMVGFKSALEVVIWSELAPFLKLEPDTGLAALAEYVVYKEMPIKADEAYLSKQVKKGLSLYEDEERESWLMAANINRFAWTSLA